MDQDRTGQDKERDVLHHDRVRVRIRVRVRVGVGVGMRVHGNRQGWP